MILKIYSEIGKILSDSLPEKELWIDLDRGQLKNQKQFESLILPSVLINFENGIDWESLQQKNQLGKAVITLKIILRLPEPLYLNNRYNNNLEALELENDVHLAFIGHSNADRIATKGYSVDTLYVVEHTYTTDFDYKPPVQQTKHYRDLNLKTTLQVQK